MCFIFLTGYPRCPGNSLTKFAEFKQPYLSQRRPKSSVSETKLGWYDNAPLDRNTIAIMMSMIIKESELSVVYTNYYIASARLAPQLCSLFLYSYEAEFVHKLLRDKNKKKNLQKTSRVLQPYTQIYRLISYRSKSQFSQLCPLDISR
jgi:hypothetical protein